MSESGSGMVILGLTVAAIVGLGVYVGGSNRKGRTLPRSGRDERESRITTIRYDAHLRQLDRSRRSDVHGGRKRS